MGYSRLCLQNIECTFNLESGFCTSLAPYCQTLSSSLTKDIASGMLLREFWVSNFELPLKMIARAELIAV